MFRSLCRVGDKLLLVVRRRIPKDFGHIPGTISVVNDQAVSLLLEFVIGEHERLRGRPLKKSPRLRVKRRTQKIVGARVPDIQFYGWIELHKFNQVRMPERPFFRRRRGLERLRAQFFHRPQRRNAETHLLCFKKGRQRHRKEEKTTAKREERL